MKKIMFDDKYGLTDAVLNGFKTMTRRPVSEICLQQAEAYRHEYYADTLDALPLEEALLEFSPFKIGEVVAVAQRYEDVYEEMLCNGTDSLENARPILKHSEDIGWENKIFVRADLMPHQIRITNVRVERLQDISDEDCLKEGIKVYNCGIDFGYKADGVRGTFGTAREAFSALIDKVSGKGTWQSNPWVFVYEFELIK